MADAKIPDDPHNLVYAIFYWLGIGSLLPWNFFIAVTAYWMEKFGDVSSPKMSLNGELTPLQLQWNSYLSIASMIPNVTFLLLNAIFGHKFKTQPRLVISLVVIIVLFIFSDVMTVVNTDEWQTTFLIVTLVSVVIINIMVAIFQGGLSGVAGQFPPAYMGAVVQGQALGGTFAAATNIVMLAFGAGAVSAAFYDFLIAVVFLATALMAFLVLMRTEFYKFHMKSNDERQVEADQLIGSKSPVSVNNTEEKSSVRILHICARIWIWIAAVFTCFLVTLAVFPAITSLARSTGSDNAWSDIYFIPVGCFLLFNIGDFFGRLLASYLQWPKATHFGSLVMLGASLARLAFIPLFLFANISPDNRSVTWVAFESDSVYLATMVAFSVSNGYIGSICMIFGPKMLTDGRDQGQAASLLVSFLVSGLAVGAALSGLVVKLL